MKIAGYVIKIECSSNREFAAIYTISIIFNPKTNKISNRIVVFITRLSQGKSLLFPKAPVRQIALFIVFASQAWVMATLCGCFWWVGIKMHEPLIFNFDMQRLVSSPPEYSLYNDDNGQTRQH
jgi:hypothetical protein